MNHVHKVELSTTEVKEILIEYLKNQMGFVSEIGIIGKNERTVLTIAKGKWISDSVEERI